MTSSRQKPRIKLSNVRFIKAFKLRDTVPSNNNGDGYSCKARGDSRCERALFHDPFDHTLNLYNHPLP